MFEELINRLTSEEKMKLVNMILLQMPPVIDIENRGTSDDYVMKPLIYNKDTKEIYIEFEEIEREAGENE